MQAMFDYLFIHMMTQKGRVNSCFLHYCKTARFEKLQSDTGWAGTKKLLDVCGWQQPAITYTPNGRQQQSIHNRNGVAIYADNASTDEFNSIHESNSIQCQLFPI